MAEVVKVQVGTAGGLAGLVPGPVERAGSDGLPGLAGEEPGVGPRADVLRQVLGDQGCDVAGDSDGSPACIRLWRRDGMRAVLMDGEGPLYLQAAVQLIDVSALQSEDLTPP
jgi:hypothetical protein